MPKRFVRSFSFASLTTVALLSACGPSVESPPEAGGSTGSTTRASGPVGPSSPKVKPANKPLPASVFVTPTEGVDFGKVAIEQTQDATVRLVNAGGSTASGITSPASTVAFKFKGGFFPGTGGTCSNDLKADQGCTLVVTFAPVAMTKYHEVLSIDYNDGENDQTTGVDLKGEGGPKLPGGTTGGGTGGSTGGTTGGGTGGGSTGGSGGLTFLGDMPVNDGETAELEVTIDETVAGISIAAVHENASHYVLINEIKNPNGVVLASGWNPGAHQNRSYFNNGAQGVQIPQTPDINSLFVPGTYKFKVWVETIDEVKVDNSTIAVFVGKRLRTQAVSTLDVNFFLSGSAGLTKATATTQARFVAAVEDFKLLYSDLGITIGTINYFDIDSAYQEVVGEYQNQFAGKKSMAELWSLGASAPAGLNFFFIESVDPDNSGPQGILGISGGIPGPSSRMDTTRSGVIVAYDSSQVFAGDDLGSTIAHEGGHYLGLWHTRESSGSHDNISDTPQNAAASANCMFWAADPSARDFSPMQQQAVKLNLLVR